MVESVHRHVNGTEVTLHDLPGYKITNQTILDIIHDAAKRSMNGQNASIHRMPLQSIQLQSFISSKDLRTLETFTITTI